MYLMNKVTVPSANSENMLTDERPDLRSSRKLQDLVLDRMVSCESFQRNRRIMIDAHERSLQKLHAEKIRLSRKMYFKFQKLLNAKGSRDRRKIAKLNKSVDDVLDKIQCCDRKKKRCQRKLEEKKWKLHMNQAYMDRLYKRHIQLRENIRREDEFTNEDEVVDFGMLPKAPLIKILEQCGYNELMNISAASRKMKNLIDACKTLEYPPYRVAIVLDEEGKIFRLSAIRICFDHILNDGSFTISSGREHEWPNLVIARRQIALKIRANNVTEESVQLLCKLLEKTTVIQLNIEGVLNEFVGQLVDSLEISTVIMKNCRRNAESEFLVPRVRSFQVIDGYFSDVVTTDQLNFLRQNKNIEYLEINILKRQEPDISRMMGEWQRGERQIKKWVLYNSNFSFSGMDPILNISRSKYLEVSIYHEAGKIVITETAHTVE